MGSMALTFSLVETPNQKVWHCFCHFFLSVYDFGVCQQLRIKNLSVDTPALNSSGSIGDQLQFEKGLDG